MGIVIPNKRRSVSADIRTEWGENQFIRDRQKKKKTRHFAFMFRMTINTFILVKFIHFTILKYFQSPDSPYLGLFLSFFIFLSWYSSTFYIGYNLIIIFFSIIYLLWLKYRLQEARVLDFYSLIYLYFWEGSLSHRKHSH